MRTLFLVHCEIAFEYCMEDENFINRVKKEINKADKVIILESLIDRDNVVLPEIEEHIQLKNKSFEKWEWGWGYEPEMFTDITEYHNCIKTTSSQHEYTWIPPELRNIRQEKFGKIMVAGGARGECLDDFLNILDFINLKYECPEVLTFGYVHQKKSKVNLVY